MNDSPPSPPSSSQGVRVLLLFGWSCAILLAWSWWSLGLFAPVDGKPLTDGAVGCGMLITSGCCGSTWLFGVVAMSAVYALVRR